MTFDMLLDLYQVYRSRGDSYHGMSHMRECFAELTKLVDANLIENEEAMRLAIWFHDYYQNHTGDDEECSAKKAHAAALALGYDETFAKIVYRLILVTKHGVHSPVTNDEKFMVDIDLAPFAADNFAERTMKVRVEYPNVDDNTFLLARREVLAGFLALPGIYHTPYYKERLEASAQRNLAVAVGALSSSESTTIKK